MAILKIRDKNGNIQEILAIKGKDGADGTVTFENLTPEQKESLKGEKGDSYILTPDDKTEIANQVLASIADAEGVAF